MKTITSNFFGDTLIVIGLLSCLTVAVIQAAPPIINNIPPTLESGTYKLKCFHLGKGPYTPETVHLDITNDVLRFQTKHMSCVGVIDGTKVQIMALGHLELFFGRTDPDYKTVRGMVTIQGKEQYKFELEKTD